MNNKLTNKGWQAMRQILDREMPVEQKRRPFLWFWLLGLLLGLGFTLGWLFWPGKSPAPAPSPAVPVAEFVEPVQAPEKLSGTASLPESVSAPAAGSTASPVDSEGSLSTKQQEMISHATTNAGNSKAKPGTSEPLEQSKAVQTSALITKDEAAQTLEQAPSNFIEKTNSPQKETPSVVLLDTPASEEVPAVSPGESTETGLAETQPSVQPPTPSTAEIQPSLPTEPNPSDLPPTLSTPIDPVAKRKTWASGATAGVLSTLNPGYSGASIGFTTEWQPQAKWGLRSGIAYQYQTLRENDRAILSITTGSYVEATGDLTPLTTSNTGSLNPDEYLAPVYIPVSRLHRLEAPLLGFWQPLKRWRVYGGFALGTTVYAQSGTRSLKNNQVFDIKAGTPARNLNSEISTQVRNWDFRWSAGLGFKPSRRFAFDLLLHNPLHFGRVSTSGLDKLDYPGPAEVFSSSGSSNRLKAAGELSLLQFSATLFF